MKSKFVRLTTLIGFFALIFSPTSVWAAEEEKPTASADVGIFSKYIWRGYELSKDSIVIQPSATMAYKGFSLNMWGNLDTDVYGDDRDEGKRQIISSPQAASAKILRSCLAVLLFLSHFKIGRLRHGGPESSGSSRDEGSNKMRSLQKNYP